MKCIILAGGSGTRLWPLSRKTYPKQFLKIGDELTLLQRTVKRLLHTVGKDDLIIITNKEYKFHVINQAKEIDFDFGSNILLEPVGRNTAPAIALAVQYVLDKLKCSEDEVLFISPSDHLIVPESRFTEYLNMALEPARNGFIVTLGIQPYKPETGYGYIRRGRPVDTVRGKSNDTYRVERFVEKPDFETAREYVASGDYYWNSGMFAFSVRTIKQELEKYAPAIFDTFTKGFDEMLLDFRNMPEISLDYAVMEKSDRVVVLPLDITWSDIGSWDSVYEMLAKDPEQNVTIGQVMSIDTKNSLIISNRRLISTVGLEEFLVVETDDAILITKKGEAQKVKDIVNKLIKENRKEALEHTTINRPWGKYTILEEGQRYKIKRIVVKPCAKLSTQMHHHRSEHWIVIKGTAQVMIGGEEKIIHENESTYVPKSTLHRLSNPGKVFLEIIEVQNGEYVGEDDIVRFDDMYGRTENRDAG